MPSFKAVPVSPRYTDPTETPDMRANDGSGREALRAVEAFWANISNLSEDQTVQAEGRFGGVALVCEEAWESSGSRHPDADSRLASSKW